MVYTMPRVLIAKRTYKSDESTEIADLSAEETQHNTEATGVELENTEQRQSEQANTEITRYY